jgi:hypothetical protein
MPDSDWAVPPAGHWIMKLELLELEHMHCEIYVRELGKAMYAGMWHS